ncbi:MAG TPA: diphosphomevalonate decarboxylase [Pseudomonadales bacterium]
MAAGGASAEAHPNIALVKYWGKRPGVDNVPATPSLSITLSQLRTRTRVDLEDAAGVRVRLNGAIVQDAKIDACVERLLARAPHCPSGLRIETDNNFPTAAGLASSASGFAALITAMDAALELHMTDEERSLEARRASASAARSLYGGFVTLHGSNDPDTWIARPELSAAAWPLAVVIAICATKRKDVSSGEGMRRSTTSPYYSRWTEIAAVDFDGARAAVAARDFARLAGIAENNCLAMHAVMLSARPSLLYWNGATVDCMACISALRAAGEPVFFTIDAGPQVKAVCEPGAARRVRAALAQVPGVEEVLVVGLGEAARLTA